MPNKIGTPVTKRDRAIQVMGIFQGLMHALTGLLMVTGVKSFPKIVENTGINTWMAYIWAAGLLIFGLGYSFGVMFRYKRPSVYFAFSYPSLIALAGAVAIYGISAWTSFGFLSGIITVAICASLVCFMATHWLMLNEKLHRMKKGQKITLDEEQE